MSKLALPPGVMRDRLIAAERIMAVTFNRAAWESELEAQLKITRKQAKRYIRAVTRLWAARARADPDEVRLELLSKFEMLFERALRADDLRAAERILDRIGELRGATGPAAEEFRGSQVIVIREDGLTMNRITSGAREQRKRMLSADTMEET